MNLLDEELQPAPWTKPSLSFFCGGGGGSAVYDVIVYVRDVCTPTRVHAMYSIVEPLGLLGRPCKRDASLIRTQSQVPVI